MSIGLYHFLGLGAALFSIGIMGVITRRNAIGVLIGVDVGREHRRARHHTYE